MSCGISRSHTVNESTNVTGSACHQYCNKKLYEMEHNRTNSNKKLKPEQKIARLLLQCDSFALNYICAIWTTLDLLLGVFFSTFVCHFWHVRAFAAIYGVLKIVVNLHCEWKFHFFWAKANRVKIDIEYLA